MINMNLFGIPNVGAQLCNDKSNLTMERLCAHYFMLSVISPLAFFVDQRNDSLEEHPFNFKDQADKLAITQALQTRAGLTLYMREQLRKIAIQGGALIRPAFTEFDSINHNDTEDFQTVMYGDSILATFLFYDVKTTRTVTLPKENDWVLLSMEGKMYKGGDQYTFEQTPFEEVVGLKLFQKAGTVIVY
jgi:alpha-glucosidase (family GH31 glycosyl hydrolase)